ncbi:MAG: hypothetical protein R6U64_03665 [Bacteroidales bacterium]
MQSLRFIIAAFFFLLLSIQGVSQLPWRDKKIPAAPASQQLDSLSIIQDSFTIRGPDGLPLDSAFYNLDPVRARISLRVPEYWKADSLRVRYRVFPVNFSEPYFHKDTSLIREPGPGEDVPRIALPGRAPSEGLISSSTLQTSGSITRGITLGNRQDVSLNSAMNLQLAGSLSEQIGVAAVISDQDIPFQPDGTTRQVQDFDKIFIRLTGYGGELTAGDFELNRPSGYFMNFSRQAQGGRLNYSAGIDSSQSVLPGGSMQVTAAGAIAKGKYTRNQLTAVEGNQGPYRLTGASNESYIMVLAGSEKVYIDGVLLVRGMDHDYVIDYNMAELTFTPRRMITRNSRIVVEFEYAERNYARSLMFTGVELKNKQAAFRFNFFSQQDHPGQPLFQELSDENIRRMQQAGDSLHQAYAWNVDSIGFQNDRVMYRLTDSLGVDTVFVHSTDPERAVYRVGFTYMGEGKGNYRSVNAAANGRVFQWMAPVDGMPQGTHDPIIQLITPKKEQLMSMGADFQVAHNTQAGLEFALSNRDRNLFSDLHQSGNTGYALKVHAQNSTAISRWGDGQWLLRLNGNHEVAGSNFSPLERYRAVEFERDWNLEQDQTDKLEHLSLLEVQLQHPELGGVAYRFRSLFREESFQGVINSLDAAILFKKNRIFFNGSFLSSDGTRQTAFYRHKAGFSRPLFFLTAGVEHHTEQNVIKHNDQESLSTGSSSFDELTFFIANGDASRNRYRLFYKMRSDQLPMADELLEATRASEVGATWQMTHDSDQRMDITAMHRTLEFMQPQRSRQEKESNLAGRLDYFSRWNEGLIVSSLFYEAASGMERQREYVYLEVPSGQGVFTWNDYNSNEIMELDEFETAAYPDQANFIRIFIPTEEFASIFSNTLSHNLVVDPSVIWKEKAGLRKLLSRFYNQMVYRVNQKTQGAITPGSFNPFGYAIEDETLVSLNTSFRNTLFFNRTHPVFDAEFNIQDSRNKMLLSNGFEVKVLKSTGIRARWNVNQNYSLIISGSRSLNDNRSEYFTNRNYLLEEYQAAPTISYQMDGRYRISLFVGYSQKKNLQQHEKGNTWSAGASFRYSTPGRSTLNGRYELSDIDYPFAEHTPLAFAVLEGKRPGLNHEWNIGWQQNLNAWLQLNVTYHGRIPYHQKAVHAGSMQLRALF